MKQKMFEFAIVLNSILLKQYPIFSGCEIQNTIIARRMVTDINKINNCDLAAAVIIGISSRTGLLCGTICNIVCYNVG